LERCKQGIELIAETLGLEGFSRIDAFVHVETGEVLVIEVNTVPGMTPSTVLIQQVTFAFLFVQQKCCLQFQSNLYHKHIFERFVLGILLMST
jgi:carbamoylphosphate synthase large subunit